MNEYDIIDEVPGCIEDRALIIVEHRYYICHVISGNKYLYGFDASETTHPTQQNYWSYKYLNDSGFWVRREDYYSQEDLFSDP